ncbi:MAG: methionyl-tRNA formyltransferase [Eubacteriales bacterium]|nr:methionyl-tRNA formyltransferase [Eubacteriales bacterium]
MKIVFMGTPDFAVPTLTALYNAGYEIAAVVSQPDKPKGRHAELVPTPVKAKALELSIPVLQPIKARDAEFIAQLKEIAPDLIVVTAYGQILKKELLDIPKYGCINVHASLLPRWRGAAPIQWAVIEGDEYAGVTTMQMNEGLDTGDMLLKRSLKLSDDETGGSLFDKLSEIGGELIVETVKLLEKGELKPVPQPEEGMTYASMLKKENGNIDWSKSAIEIDQLIRGLTPWPGSYTKLNNKNLKIHKSVPCNMDDESISSIYDKADKDFGRAVVVNGRLFVICKDSMLELLEVQLEGKKRMDAASFIRGAENILKESPVFVHAD